MSSNLTLSANKNREFSRRDSFGEGARLSEGLLRVCRKLYREFSRRDAFGRISPSPQIKTVSSPEGILLAESHTFLKKLVNGLCIMRIYFKV